MKSIIIIIFLLITGLSGVTTATAQNLLKKDLPLGTLGYKNLSEYYDGTREGMGLCAKHAQLQFYNWVEVYEVIEYKPGLGVKVWHQLGHIFLCDKREYELRLILASSDDEIKKIDYAVKHDQKWLCYEGNELQFFSKQDDCGECLRKHIKAKEAKWDKEKSESLSEAAKKTAGKQ